MIHIVTVLLLLLKPIEYLFGFEVIGFDFLLPLLMFFPRLRLRLNYFVFLLLFFFVFSLYLSFSLSNYHIPYGAFTISATFYLYPFILYIFGSSWRLSYEDLRRTAVLFIFNFLIIRILMFTDLDQKSFPMHDYAFNAALLTFSFLYFYYFETDNKVRIIYLSIIFVLLLSVLMLKTIIALSCFVLWDFFKRRSLFETLSLTLLLVLILYYSPVFSKIDDYYTMYYLNDNAREIPRNLMNLQAILFAYEYFPFGVGPGIFWGFPISLYGSELYFDLGYNLVEGLNPDKLDEVNFIFDVFWAGILGEGGVLSVLFFIAIFYLPIIKLRSKRSNMFFTAFFVLIFLQSFVLSIMAQPLFLLLLITYPLGHGKYLGFKNEIMDLN